MSKELEVCPCGRRACNTVSPDSDAGDFYACLLVAEKRLAELEDVVRSIPDYPTGDRCATCRQPDAGTHPRGVMGILTWRAANNWRGCGNVWHEQYAVELRKQARKKAELLAILCPTEAIAP